MDDTIRDDVLIGAKDIGAFLGIPQRKVYTMREEGSPLVKHEPGIGLVARKSVLLRSFGIAETMAAE